MDAVGYLAALLVFCTCYMKTMLPLRVIAIASNVARLGPGSVIGEMGVFGPSHRRTRTAVGETKVEIGSISDQQAAQLYYQNPAYGFHLFRIVVQRVLENERRWREKYMDAPRGAQLPAKSS